MVSSACDVLLNEPDRFVNYVLSNRKNRSKIYDKESFAKVLEESLKSDPTLKNIPQEIKRNKESMARCGEAIFNTPQIKSLARSNLNKKKQELRRKLMRDRPNLKGKNFNKELNRRLNISLGVSSAKRLKQVTIDESLKPIRVKYIDPRSNKTVIYNKSKSRSLTRQERALIVNAISKKKKPSQIIQDYYNAGFKFRTSESIRKYYYRLR